MGAMSSYFHAEFSSEPSSCKHSVFEIASIASYEMRQPCTGDRGANIQIDPINTTGSWAMKSSSQIPNFKQV